MSETPEQNEVEPSSGTPEKAERWPSWTRHASQALVRLSPLVGSGLLATKAVQEQDWVQALETFPVAAVSAAWAAYSGAFVAALEEEVGKLGDKNAREVAQWPGAIARTLQWQFSRFERKYRQKQLLKCLYNDVEGYDAGGTVPLLEDVYVPLELSGDLASGPDGRVLPLQLGSRFGFWRQKLSELKTLDIWDFLSQVRKGQEYRQLVILAWGGFGKTTLLRHITAAYARGGRRRRRTPKLVPFFIRLRKWGAVLAAQDAPRLAEFLRDRHIAEGLELGPPPLAWVQHLLETGQALVLLDGFDEVPAEQREAVSHWIGRELEACSQAVFILSSRPGGYEDYVSERKPRTKLFVKPFTLDQIRDFTSKWYVCQERLYRDKSAENREAVAAIAREKTQDLIGQVEKRKELRDLSSNPLLLNMLANYHRFYQGAELPKRRGDLYRDVFKMQLCDRPLAKGKEMDPPWPENQPILQGLALAMVRQKLVTISEAQLLEQLAPSLGEEAISSDEFLKQIAEVSELLVERERQEYEFAHLSFQEYLAAAEIERQGLEGELLENYRESHWQGTIVLYAALTNPNRLLRGLIEKGTPEAAELAYKCLKETPRKVDEGLRVEVQQARLQELEKLLANGKWREADEETFRIMIRTVGKEEGQYFDREDLENFPCEELRELDRLWVKYSEGAWGFSVQKRVWQECGCPTDLDEWKKFCDRVEWRQGGEWVSHNDLQIKTEPKHAAQLPSKWSGRWRPGGGVSLRVSTVVTEGWSVVRGGGRVLLSRSEL